MEADFIDELSKVDLVANLKLEADEKDELGPIVDTPFRSRCYTWPRQCLQGCLKNLLQSEKWEIVEQLKSFEICLFKKPVLPTSFDC